MIVIFAVFLAAIVSSSRLKPTELTLNEKYEDKLARRAGGNEDDNSKQVISDEIHLDIGNRDDKSYIPDVDYALAGNIRRSYMEKNTANNDNFDKNTREENKVNNENNTLDYETTTGNSDTVQTEVTNTFIKNTTGMSTTATNTSMVLSLNENHSKDKPTNLDILVLENDLVNNFELSSKATESYNQGNIGILTDDSTNKFTTINVNADVFTTMAQNTAKVDKTTTENYRSVTENSLANKHLVTITKITTNLPALTPTFEEEKSTKIPKKTSTVNEIENMTKSEKCLNCYRVYEILSPTKHRNQQFIKNPEPFIDKSHSIPVYKYSPNWAYKNLKNRVGSNKVDDNTKELDTRTLGINNIVFIDGTGKASELVSDFFINLRKLNKKKNTISKESEKTHGTKSKVKKIVRVFDDPHLDQIPELMLAKNKEPITYEKLVAFKNAQIQHIFSLKDIKIKKRSNSESKTRIHMDVVKDLILKDSKALHQYDWLATTLQIQSALKKILKLIDHMRQSEAIHPEDLQILKYIVFLHNFSLGVKEEKKLDNKKEKRAKLLPRNKKKRKNNLLQERGLINRVWLRRTQLPDAVEVDDFSNLYDFVVKVQDGLYDLHEAIRQIAGVTKFDHQTWYSNLKQLYLSVEEKHLRELLLHILMSRLIDLVEHSCKQGLDNNFVHFLDSHEKDAKRIVEEMLFIDEIIDEIGIIK